MQLHAGGSDRRQGGQLHGDRPKRLQRLDQHHDRHFGLTYGPAHHGAQRRQPGQRHAEHPYVDAGATAYDLCAQASLTVSSNSTVNTSVAGVYAVTYSAATADGTPGPLRGPSMSLRPSILGECAHL